MSYWRLLKLQTGWTKTNSMENNQSLKLLYEGKYSKEELKTLLGDLTEEQLQHFRASAQRADNQLDFFWNFKNLN